MSITELIERVKHAVLPSAGRGDAGRERRALYVEDMDEELVAALAAANVDHLDAQPKSAAK
jgi:hypothetical protein